MILVQEVYAWCREKCRIHTTRKKRFKWCKERAELKKSAFGAQKQAING